MASLKLAVRRALGRCPKDITRPPNCVNQILVGSPVDLGSKPTDMRLHDLRFGVEVKLPYLLKEHGARDHTNGIAPEIFEQPEGTPLAEGRSSCRRVSPFVRSDPFPDRRREMSSEPERVEGGAQARSAERSVQKTRRASSNSRHPRHSTLPPDHQCR